MTEEQMARYIRVWREWPDSQEGNFQLIQLYTHKSPMMTQRYAHLRDETLKRGANIMSRFVAAAEEKVAEKAE